MRHALVHGRLRNLPLAGVYTREDPVADRMSFWAWGLESEEPTDQDRAKLAKHLSRRFKTAITPKPIPDLADADLRPPRIEPPESLAPFCLTDTYERARHSYGAHFTDRTRALSPPLAAQEPCRAPSPS